jgi:transposase
MANKPITMIQLTRIIQLKSEGVNKHQISQILNLHRKTLDEYLQKFESSGKSYQQLLACREAELAFIVYSSPNTNKPDERLIEFEKQFEYFNTELLRVGVTLKTLWEEYIAGDPQGYKYSQFCEHYARYKKRNSATMHFEHREGENLQVDFAGKPLYYIDRESGEFIECPVLICTLPYSNYNYVEALSSSRQEPLFGSLSRCLEYLGGVPRNVISDNMKQYVKKNDRYEYTFQDLANQWSTHYHTNLVATRPGKPKDKPSVENHVYVSYLRIYAKLRNEQFFSLRELNARIRELLDEMNRHGFKKLPGNRMERFMEHEKSTLKPLPGEAFVIKHRTHAKVQMNYHVILGEDKHQYSVPHQYIGKQTTISYDERTVEIYIGLDRIAVHIRSYRKHGYTTLPEHMPEKHLKHRETLGWDADYFLSKAEKMGESSFGVFKKILASKDLIEQTYKACIGLIRLSDQYGIDRFEQACSRAMRGNRVTYMMIKNILVNNLDKLPIIPLTLFSIPVHENIRGEHEYKD